MIENISKLTSNIKTFLQTIIICLGSAFVLAFASQISIPLPNGVPMTLQTFSVALLGYSLSEDKGIKAILTYLLLGILGVGVFASGNSGISTVLGLTGGFLLGFIPLVLFCNKAKKVKNTMNKILLSMVGLIILHIFGILQYSILTGINIIKVATLVSIPFLLKDALSVLLAFIISNKVKIKHLQ